MYIYYMYMHMYLYILHVHTHMNVHIHIHVHVVTGKTLPERHCVIGRKRQQKACKQQETREHPQTRERLYKN